MSNSNQGIDVLYLDDTCKVTNVCILLKKYYFPLPTSRSILYEEIEKVTLGSSLHFNQKWGISVHDANNWFPYDSKRRNKSLYIGFHLKGKKIIPSFTPLDGAKVFTILKQVAASRGLSHIVFEDQVIEQENSFQPIQELQSESSTLTKNFLKESTGDNILKNK